MDWSDENQVRYFTQEGTAIQSILQYVVVNCLQRRLSKGSTLSNVVTSWNFFEGLNILISTF
jgi:hypothetical protein